MIPSLARSKVYRPPLEIEYVEESVEERYFGELKEIYNESEICEEVPISLVFGLDSSGSMGGTDPLNLRLEASKNTIDMLNSSEDEVGVVSWDENVDFSQELTDNLGVFARYGWQNPKVYLNGEDFSLEQFWSAGFQLSGNLWGRDEDVLGLVFGQVFPSDDYKNANNLRAKSEDHLEVYYSFKVNEHLTLSPDLQVIWDPYGGDAVNGSKTVVVGGMRTQVDF